ncbi:MAG TPA: hypothetical protein VGO62_20025 [Myxococcota bacterium]|jgi:CTP synthase (UTP-ammonia lyase)
MKIGLIGDRNDNVTAHRAIPLALARSAARLETSVDVEWVPTASIDAVARVAAFAGLWCVPASPYVSEAGALRAIRHARVAGVPLLATCGGFQHALLEYAHSVLGWDDSVHAETAPDGKRLLLAPLQCSLVEVRAPIRLLAGSRIAQAYNRTAIVEGYHCSYGLNPAYASELLSGALEATGWDDNDEVRAVELAGHSFFVGTLFQPERAALEDTEAPLVTAFLRAAM